VNTKDDWSDSGILLHSKDQSKKFIDNDYQGFLEKIDKALDK
jgi:hypothetical protein